MDMKIHRVGSRPSRQGSADCFTGSVRIDPLFDAAEEIQENDTQKISNVPARISAAVVTFEPNARSAWHRHPLGQYLIVTAGCGWTQCWGSPKKEIRAGDVVFCNCGKKHWHGATATCGMSHIAVQESLNGTAIEWLEKVSDDQYLSTVEAD